MLVVCREFKDEKQCVLEFAESLQHTSKSVERYAFLMWILCTHALWSVLPPT